MQDQLQLALCVIAEKKNIPVNELQQIIENAGKAPEAPHTALLSKKDVASRLNISLPTVDRFIKKGYLRKVTLSSQIVRIPLDSVEKYLVSRSSK